MRHIDRVADYVLWYGKDAERTKFRPAYQVKSLEKFAYEYKFKQDAAGYRNSNVRFEAGDDEATVYAVKPLTSQTTASTTVYDGSMPFSVERNVFI
jgi:adenine-specific DNA-methyltransferase